MQHNPSDLEFISMIVNKPLKLFNLCLLCAAMMGCGGSLGVGGASIEGTGNGQPPAPGLGNAGDGFAIKDPLDGKTQLQLNLSEPVVDICNMVLRDLYFIDPIKQTLLQQKQSFLLSENTSGQYPLELALILENLHDQVIHIEYSECDVPLILNNPDYSYQYFPVRTCGAVKTEKLEPNTVRTFKLKYNLDAPMHGIWSIDPKMKITVPDLPDETCEALQLPFQMNVIKS